MTTLRATTHIAVSVALALSGAGCANHEADTTWHAMEPSAAPPANAVTSTGSLPVGPGPTHYTVQQQPPAGNIVAGVLSYPMTPDDPEHYAGVDSAITTVMAAIR